MVTFVWRWARRAGLLTLIGIVEFGTVSCSSSHSGSASTANGPIVNMGIPDRDIDPALAVVEKEFGGCLSGGIDVIGGSTVLPPTFAKKMVLHIGRTHLVGQAVRPDYNPLVVELREGEMFLVELDPTGQKGAAAFNDAGADMLAAARTAGDSCGSVAAARYGNRGTTESR